MVSPARNLAYSMLWRIAVRDGHSSYLLNSDEMAKLKPVDRKLVTEIVLGTLRWQKRLDWMIENYARRKVDGIDPEILTILRMGLYQLKFLSKIPPSAAVNEAVSLAKKMRFSKAAGFVNAVLRRAAEDKQPEARLAEIKDPVARLAITTSHPEWLIARWIQRYGEQTAARMALANNRPPRIAIRLNRKRASPEELKRKLASCHIDFRESPYVPDCLLVKTAAIAQLDVYREGWFHFQDEASQMIPALFGDFAAARLRRIVDICSAPGGKTAMLAEAVSEDGRVVAVDVNLQRQALVGERMSTLGHTNVLIVVADATRALPFKAEFDAALVDVPCSGLGTIRRNPEIKWRIRESELDLFGDRQLKMLKNASAHVRLEGLLLYSTCSTEPEENQNVVQKFLSERRDFVLTRPHLSEPLRRFLTEENFFQTFPADPELDGFFAALMRRISRSPSHEA